MQVKATKIADSTYELEVEVDEKAWEAGKAKAFKKISSNITVQGFRKGKAPEHLVKSKVNPTELIQEGVKEVLDEAFSFAIKETSHYPVVQPRYDIVKVSDSELTLKFTVVVAPTVTLGAYKDLKIGHSDVSVTEAEVEEKVNSLLLDGAELVLKEGAAELGDIVTLDFEGFVDEVAFEGGKAENHELELGSGQFIPGFEEALVGVKSGEERDVHVTFPENYHENLKNKKAVFKTKTHEIKTKKSATLTNEFAASLSLPNVSDIASLKAHLRVELLKEKEADEQKEYIDKLIAKIRETSTFEVAEEIVHEEDHHMIHQLQEQVKQQGLTWEDYLQFSGQTFDEIHDRFHTEARVNIERFLIVNQIAISEKIETTEEDVNFEIAKIAQNANLTEEKVREILGENINNVKSDLRQRRVFDFLVENNK